MNNSMRTLILIAVPVALVVSAAVYWLFWMESADFRKYKRLRIGMSVEEVQAILGPGSPLKQENVPQIVVEVNPADVDDSNERARRAGITTPTARDYPTRRKPVVEGDVILKWENGETREVILVAFKDGKVCEKYYWDPNYL